MSGHSYQNKIHIDKKSTETKISYVDILHLKAQFNCYFLVVFFLLLERISMVQLNINRELRYTYVSHTY